MSLLFISSVEDPERWRDEFARVLPAEDFRVWPDTGPREAVEFLLVWRPERGSMKGFPNLKAILNMGAGVDYLLADPDLPRDAPLVRLVDKGLTDGMVEFVLHAVLHFHRDFHRYRAMQARKEWSEIPQVEAGRRRIGLLGFGHLAQAAARHLLALGFPVSGWSRTRKKVPGGEGRQNQEPGAKIAAGSLNWGASAPGVQAFAGAGEMDAFLSQSDILVCLAPHTKETEGLINKRTLARLPKGAYLVNAGRGGLTVEEDVLAALESGQLAGAWLDVFRTEPLPAASPFWTHPNVIVTPHTAAVTLPGPAALELADNIRRIRSGLPPNGLVDLGRGY
ncbi:MAG: glyoxylate/hydroxypyruvate reductase A [Alphaproteobacteria bacterium]|nr:glyoxylate/hydroxypyruvate reductase A [Alphaproteobacteria bacterium]